MRAAIFLFTFLLIAPCLSGCGGGMMPTIPPQKGNPPQDCNPPQDENPPEDNGREFTHFLFGTALIKYNSENGLLERLSQHSAQTHFNLTDPLSPPLCPDCISIEQLWHDEDAHSIGVSISLRNPSEFTFYDVRGIVRGGPGLRLLDNDGFITLFSPEPGKANPFLSYCLEKPDIDFTPNYTSSRVYSFTYENLTDLEINFIVEGSHPGHCEEPAILRLLEVNDDELTMWGGSATITMEAIDRQDNISGFIAGAPDLWGETKELIDSGDNKYKIDFSNENFAPAGTHPVFFSAWSDDPDTLLITQIAFVEVINMTATGADEFLEDGHPMEGVNYRRNNRSPYLLPTSLAAEDSVEPPMGQFGKFKDFVVGGDEKLYLGRRYLEGYGWGGGMNGDYVENFKMWVFYFGDDFEPKNAGGMKTILTKIGAFTSSRSDNSNWWSGIGPGDPSGRFSRHSSIIQYDWPAVVLMCSYTWGRLYQYIGQDDFWGDWDSPRFLDLLPLPNGTVVAACNKKDWDEEPEFLQLRDASLEAILDIEFDTPITGLAFDGDNSSIVVATNSGIYCYDFNLNEKWNNTASEPEGQYYIPVIADDGGILYCVDGKLRRAEPDGLQVTNVDCGPARRPAILNDGAIAVITDSSLRYFDQQLNEIGEVPLPSGPDTGSSYHRPPLVDAVDNMALYTGADLFVINRDGDILDQLSFDESIHEIRLGPDHFFVISGKEVFRFPSD